LIYVILGMHKSGTTLVSQILHCSGINMGENFDTNGVYERAGNKYKYERTATLWLNKAILGLTDGQFIHLKSPTELCISHEQRAQMQAIIQKCNETYVDWGFKDPRTTLVYPVWASELPQHKIIAVYRSPGELWPRFRYEGFHHQFKNPYRAWQLMSRWCEYNSRLLTYLENTNMDYLVLSYRKLMATDTEINRLQEFVGVKLIDQRKPSLYHSRSESHLLMKFAARLVHTQTQCSAEKIMQHFEALRERQLTKHDDH